MIANLGLMTSYGRTEFAVFFVISLCCLIDRSLVMIDVLN